MEQGGHPDSTFSPAGQAETVGDVSTSSTSRTHGQGVVSTTASPFDDAATKLLTATTTSASSKLVAMVDEWRSTEELINGPDLEDGPELEVVSAHHCELQRAIYAYPCASLADLRAKIPVFRDEQDDAVAESLAGEAWAGLFRDIERLALASEETPRRSTAAGSPCGADAEVFALATAFCDAYVKNHHAERAYMADEISEAEWQPFHDATQALMEKLSHAEPNTIVGMGLKCLAIAGSDAWAIPRRDDPANDTFVMRIARQFEAALLTGSLSLVGLDAQSGNAPDPDAELIALAERLEEARRDEDTLWDRYEFRESRASTRRPKRPACLIFREEDHKFRLRRFHEHPAAMAGSEVTKQDIEWMSRKPLTHQVFRPVRDGQRAWRDFPGLIPEIVPWPEAQARADEIVAAWRAWGEAIDRVRAEERTDEAGDAASAATDATMAVLREIAKTPARGVKGMHAKLRALDLYSPATGSKNRPRDLILHSLLKDAGTDPLPLTAEEA